MKDKILKRAKKEFLKKGVQSISVQNLVVPLSISTKTFYKYYKNKEALLEDVLTEHYLKQFNTLKNYSETENPVSLLMRIWTKAFLHENNVNNKFYFDLHHYYPKVESKVRLSIRNIFWTEFKWIIEKGKTDGLILNDIQPDAMLESISLLYNSAVQTDQYKKFNLSIEAAFLNTIGALIRGMCTAEGLIVFKEYLYENFSEKDIRMQIVV